MSDESRRKAKRRVGEGIEEAVKFVSQELRSGGLSIERVRLSSALGNPVAQKVVGTPRWNIPELFNNDYVGSEYDLWHRINSYEITSGIRFTSEARRARGWGKIYVDLLPALFINYLSSEETRILAIDVIKMCLDDTNQKEVRSLLEELKDAVINIDTIEFLNLIGNARLREIWSRFIGLYEHSGRYELYRALMNVSADLMYGSYNRGNSIHAIISALEYNSNMFTNAWVLFSYRLIGLDA